MSSGKNSQPCRRRNQVPASRFRRAAISRVKASAPGPMSGSRPSLLGSAWWRLCLPFHQPRQSPAKTAERIRAVQSFHAADANICRWAASCPRKPNWVTTTPSATASNSWNQESPRATTATQIATNADDGDGDPSPVPGVTSLEEPAAPYLRRELGVRQGGCPRGGLLAPAAWRGIAPRSAPGPVGRPRRDPVPYAQPPSTTRTDRAAAPSPWTPPSSVSAGPPCERSRAAWPNAFGARPRTGQPATRKAGGATSTCEAGDRETTRHLTRPVVGVIRVWDDGEPLQGNA